MPRPSAPQDWFQRFFRSGFRHICVQPTSQLQSYSVSCATLQRLAHANYQRILPRDWLVKKIIAASRNFAECYTWAMKIISTTEAARRLNVSPSRIRAMIGSGRLKAMKVGKVWLIDPKNLDAVKDRKVGRPRKVRKTSKS